MKCNLKTMLKIGGILAVILAGAYFAFPSFRPAIIGLAPFTLFALCPISMFFAMRGMDKNKEHHDSYASCDHRHEEPSKSHVHN